MHAAKRTFLTQRDYHDFIRDHDGLILFTSRRDPGSTIMEDALADISAQIPISIAFIDSEAEPELLRSTGVDHAPSLFIAKDGKIRFRLAGVMDPGEVLSYYRNS